MVDLATIPRRSIVGLDGQPFRPTAKLCNAKEKADEIFALLGDRLEAIEIFFNWVLVIKWIPDRIGGVEMSEKTKTELRWQNRIGLVVKKGPTAFLDTPERPFHGCTVNIGDWVHYGPSDGHEIAFRALDNVSLGPMGLRIEDILITGTIKHPDFLI